MKRIDCLIEENEIRRRMILIIIYKDKFRVEKKNKSTLNYARFKPVIDNSDHQILMREMRNRFAENRSIILQRVCTDFKSKFRKCRLDEILKYEPDRAYHPAYPSTH